MKRATLKLNKGHLQLQNMNDKKDVFDCDWSTEIMSEFKTIDYLYYTDEVCAAIKDKATPFALKGKFALIEDLTAEFKNHNIWV